MRIAVAALLLVWASPGPQPAAAEDGSGDLLTGYRRTGLSFEGPGEWRFPAEPVWAYAYPNLRIRYRASGLGNSGIPVLTLRPGSVGPVTPGATNPENPFVAGSPVPALLDRDLIADGAEHTLEVGLAARMRTPQIDELRFALPPGGKLEIAELEFRSAAPLLPCGEAGPALPAGAVSLKVSGGAVCGQGQARATSLREKESLQIQGNGSAGRSLYLSLFPHFTNVAAFAAGLPPEKVRVPESSETSDVAVKLKYAGGEEEEQFPLSVAERRHALMNGKPGLYALELNPKLPLVSAELIDRSAHAQFVIFSAGISREAPPPSVEELPVSAVRDRRRAAPASISTEYKVAGEAAGAIRARMSKSQTSEGTRLALEVRNTGREALDFTLTFPSVTVRPGGAPADVRYVFPRQGAVVGSAERTLEAVYNAAFPLQFADVFAPRANSGAVVLVRDTEGRGKRFRLRKTGGAVEVEVDYRVRLAPGETYRPPEAQVTPHGGDWHEGFEIYRNWIASWYRPAGPRPAWLRTAFWARRDYPVGGSGKLFDVKRNRYTYDSLIEDGRAFGGIDFIDISGWAMSDTTGRVGDYPIELGGPEDLRRNVGKGLEAGIPTGLYFEGYLIDKRSKVGTGQAGRWQLINEKGQGAWWRGGDPTELFVCPWVREWQSYLSERVASVAASTGAGAVYLDEFGFGRMRCYSPSHGHAVGAETLPGEMEMSKAVRRALDAAGRKDTMIYIEETPPDAAAPYYDAAFCYNLPHADRRLSPLKLNLFRFAFPDVRLWDMLSIGIDARVLPAEDFRLSLWHGNGLWLKGHSDTWYGEDLLEWIRRARGVLKEHADAFAGAADPLVQSPHPAVFVNRFTSGSKTVYTLFNASYRTARFSFQGRQFRLPPRDVEVVPGK